MNRRLRNPIFLAFLSAFLLRLSFPSFDLWPLAWFGFVPFFFSIKNAGSKKAFWLGFLTGALFFVTVLYWLVNVTAAGMVALSLGLSFYFSFFALFVVWSRRRFDFWRRLVLIPAAWMILEFLRSHVLSGFPWVLLSHSQSFNPVAIQISDIGGAFLVSYLLMFANVFFFEVLESLAAKRFLKRWELFLPLLVIVFWTGYGVGRLNEDPRLSCPFKVGLVQGNIPQEIKWVYNFRSKIIAKYKLLSEILVLKEEPDLVIWPETSFPDYLEFGVNDHLLGVLASDIGRPLLAGSIRLEKEHYYNSALLYSPSGRLTALYDKMHLVPFGEYIPARRYLPFLARMIPIEDFTGGSVARIFEIPGIDCPLMRFGVMICFEDIFSPLARNLVKRGADFLVNVTNDAWFGDTHSPYQHFESSIFRAVENRVYVVRAANTGVTGIIDDRGIPQSVVRDQKGKRTFVTGSVSGLVYRTERGSFYARFGDWWVALCFFLLGWSVLGLRSGKKIGILI